MSAVCSFKADAQLANPFGFENNTAATWAGTGSTETATINSTGANIRTGSYSLKLTTTSTGTGNKQWYSDTPYVASGSGIYIYYIYWAKAQDAGTSVDASLRYSSTAPPSGSGSSSNASGATALSTTSWTRVTNGVNTSSTRYYFPGPRKTASAGATSFYMDDGVLYTSALSTVDTTDPGAPSALAGTVFGNLVNLAWTSNTDAGTGVQATMLLRTTNTSAAAPVLNDQAQYSVAGGSAGPNTIGAWTVVNTAIGATATSYMDAAPAPGVYKYAVVLRDVAYNYSVAAISDTITTGTPIPVIFTDTSGFVADFGSVIKNNVSGEQHYSVSGFNLSAGITVTAPVGFEVSQTSGSGFTNTFTIPQATGTVAATNVYVHYKPTGATGATGNVNVGNTSNGAAARNIAVSGNAIDMEPTSSGSISFGTITNTKIEVNLPTVGNGNKRIIVLKAGNDVTFIPADGAPVAGVNANFGIAADQGSGNKVVYDGSGSGNAVVMVTGLTHSTTYYFAVYEYNMGSGTSQNYLPGSPITALARTADTNVSVHAVSSPEGIHIFPNPSQGTVFIDAPVPVGIIVKDMTGRIVYRKEQVSNADLNDLTNGIYIIAVTDENGAALKIEKLVIQR
ncbi:T9SS type A sorting domain-containing protein [Chitinophagaceae bacterium MMS25-I14]